MVTRGEGWKGGEKTEGSHRYAVRWLTVALAVLFCNVHKTLVYNAAYFDLMLEI